MRKRKTLKIDDFCYHIRRPKYGGGSGHCSNFSTSFDGFPSFILISNIYLSCEILKTQVTAGQSFFQITYNDIDRNIQRETEKLTKLTEIFKFPFSNFKDFFLFT